MFTIKKTKNLTFLMKRKLKKSPFLDMMNTNSRKKRQKRKHATAQLCQENRVRQGKHTVRSYFKCQPTNFIDKYDVKRLTRFKLKEVSLSTLDELKANVKRPAYEYKVISGIHCVYNYLHCVAMCTEWLRKRLEQVGLAQNCSAYQPVSVSHSVPELLESFYQCLLINIELVRRSRQSSDSSVIIT